MKFNIFTSGLLIFFSCSLLAQEKKDLKRSIGITYSTLGSNDVINAAGRTLEGGPGYYGNGFYSIGISYVQPVNFWVGIESGIEYSKHTIKVKPMVVPGMSNPSYNTDISLVNIPLTVRLNFLKYFFVNGGLMLDLETENSGPIDNQTGIGAILGIGAKYNLDNGIGAFINGYSKFHSLIPLSTENNDYRWRLIEAGVRFGITYNF